MALSASVLAGLIENNIKSAFPSSDELNDASGEVGKLADAIAQAVVSHVTSSALVTTTTTCGAGAGSGTGTVS